MSATVPQRIAALAAQYPHRHSALLPALFIVQQARGGYLHNDDLHSVAELLQLPVARVFGVATYYTMLRMQPVGTYHLQVDTNIAAQLAGADALLAHLQQRLGIAVGQTTADGKFTLSTVEDLASCGTCPVIQVNDRYYENMSVAKADQLLESLQRDQLPAAAPDQSFRMSKCGILLRPNRNSSASAPGDCQADGAYAALRQALGMPPREIVAAVKAAGLRGRGGAGFPTGTKWELLAHAPEHPPYLVCNADEGEPGTFSDRQIMEHDPHLLIEGMAIAAYALGVQQGFIYIRGEFAWIADILETAIAEARAAGILGPNMLASNAAFDIIVHRGAGAYVCGEETALLESLEGKRGNPRLRPPFPAEHGLYGHPTIVNNVETLACVPYIVANGAAAFCRIGTPGNFGPKLFGVSGHVRRPGVFEFPLGTPLADVLEAAGGVNGQLKAVIVGGLSAPLLTASEAEGLVLDFDSCRERGTMLGSGGIIVMNDTVCIPEIALRTVAFYAHESCGQCTPCREGTRVVQALLTRLLAGQGSAADLETVVYLCSAVQGTTLCPAGDAFARPVAAMLSKFRAEFEALLQAGPAGTSA